MQRHYMEDMGNVCPFVQILCLPVLQMVDTVLEFFRLLDLPVVEQVIEVPKVSSSSCPSRAVLRAPQVVEQLVEVPTIVSYSVEQNVVIPVPHTRRPREGRRSSLPRQRVVEQTVDISVPGEGPDYRRLHVPGDHPGCGRL